MNKSIHRDCSVAGSACENLVRVHDSNLSKTSIMVRMSPEPTGRHETTIYPTGEICDHAMAYGETGDGGA